MKLGKQRVLSLPPGTQKDKGRSSLKIKKRKTSNFKSIATMNRVIITLLERQPITLGIRVCVEVPTDPQKKHLQTQLPLLSNVTQVRVCFFQ